LLKRFAAAKSERTLALAAKDEELAKAAKDTMESLLLFRGDCSTYVRAYAFLSYIFDYGNTAFEKRYLFYKCLVRLLKFGLEREGVDLSEVQLTHHRLRSAGTMGPGLTDKDAPKLNPMTELGSGTVQYKQKAFLGEIIEQLNTLFGSDMTDGDLLSYARTVSEKTLESEVLQQQAANNSKEQFANSPDLTSAILSAILDSMDAQTELSKRAIGSKDIQERLKRVLLEQLGLYEGLRARATAE
jgi:type I restriction enzyme R subunit